MTTSKELSARIAQQIKTLIKKLEKGASSSKVSDILSTDNDSVSLRKLKGIIDSAVEGCELREAEAKRAAEEAAAKEKEDDQNLYNTLRSLPSYQHLSSAEIRAIVSDMRNKASNTTTKKPRKSSKGQPQQNNSESSSSPETIKTNDSEEHQSDYESSNQTSIEPANSTVSSHGFEPSNSNGLNY